MYFTIKQAMDDSGIKISGKRKTDYIGLKGEDVKIVEKD
jgi:hypothetical protein